MEDRQHSSLKKNFSVHSTTILISMNMNDKSNEICMTLKPTHQISSYVPIPKFHETLPRFYQIVEVRFPDIDFLYMYCNL